jgi:hypothetical protein
MPPVMRQASVVFIMRDRDLDCACDECHTSSPLRKDGIKRMVNNLNR